MRRLEARYLAGLILFLASALCLLLPFLFVRQANELPHLEWSPGYWEVLPEIGLARIVPFSRAGLINPAAGAGPAAIREAANNNFPAKY